MCTELGFSPRASAKPAHKSPSEALGMECPSCGALMRSSLGPVMSAALAVLALEETSHSSATLQTNPGAQQNTRKIDEFPGVLAKHSSSMA